MIAGYTDRTLLLAIARLGNERVRRQYMGGKDDTYQIVYRGKNLEHYNPGGLVFFQRPINSGGGYWLGRTFDFVFMIEIPRPVSLREGIIYLQNYGRESPDPSDNIDEFHLQ